MSLFLILSNLCQKCIQGLIKRNHISSKIQFQIFLLLIFDIHLQEIKQRRIYTFFLFYFYIIWFCITFPYSSLWQFFIGATKTANIHSKNAAIMVLTEEKILFNFTFCVFHRCWAPGISPGSGVPERLWSRCQDLEALAGPKYQWGNQQLKVRENKNFY